MPELPEVETTRRGIAPLITGKRLKGAVVRDSRLRQPVTSGLADILKGEKIKAVSRRGKYLLLELEHGTLMIHLGMSGSLRILPAKTPPALHDHVDLLFDGECLRLRDPRRFGLVLWFDTPAREHPLLSRLGPEPFVAEFNGDYLYNLSRGRRVAVKQFIMNSRVVVGVGNIYASEALFDAGIRPTRPAGRISRSRYVALAASIRRILERAIEQGGTTLRDFRREDGNPGYFSQELKVYGKEGEPCPECGAPIRNLVIGQRSSYYCANCQR